MRALLPFAVVLCAVPARAFDDDFSYRRVFASSETRRYEVERGVYRDNEQTYAVKGVAVAAVGEPALGETIRFEELTKYADNLPFDLTQEARKFSGFAVPVSTSADPALPEMKELDTTVAGLVTDLRAVYLAVGPRSGIGGLRRVGDSFTRAEPVSLSRTGRSKTPVAEDCLTVKLALTGLTPVKAALRATFTPPGASCRPPRAPWMEKPIDPEGVPNNVWQVTRTGGTYRVQWGTETVTVDATLDRKTGALLAADLTGVRYLAERTRCAEDFTGCSVSTESVARRTLKIKAR